jgi:CheY-like chemotaxis protein/HPt (histidine-containing phosphotransfer) domain-containing protein
MMLGIGKKHELPTILLIDDDLVSREVIATVLTLHGHMVHTADHGEAALEMLTTGVCVPEVILMDAQLPGLNGMALLDRLRQQTRSSIFVISGSAAPEELEAGADGFLLKPFSADDLQRHILKQAPKSQDSGIKTEEPVINPETLSQFRQLMTEATVREIYAALVSDLKKRVDGLGVAIASGNKDEIRRIGHAIKGGCGMAGALQVARLGAIFESKSDQLDNCMAALQELSVATGKLERMLEKEFPA